MSDGGASRPSAWGPEHRRAAIAVTFDNLGEASELERGQWRSGAPLGRHASVTRALPQVLELLAELGLRATFFVEGVNSSLYPGTLQQIDAAGHEVAYHGWRHESWSDLDGTRERDLLQRGVQALAELGLRPVGFRPPGGRLTPSSFAALSDLGFTYCSPAGDGASVHGRVAILPFRWTLIDAFHYLPSFAHRRGVVHGSPDPLPPSVLRAAVTDAISRATDRSAFVATLFHPFLADTEDRLEAMRAVLNCVRAFVTERGVWCAPLREIAAWMLDQPSASSWDLGLDES